MPTNPSNPAPDLAQLARDCEARAAAGEKPVLEWTCDGINSDYSWDQSSPQCLNVFVRGTRSTSRWVVYGVGARTTELSSEHAAQLFAESLLRAATAPLHPQAPEVAAAVLMARDVLNGVPVRRAAMDRGLMVRVSRNDIRFTALGRALLASATPDPAPTPEEATLDLAAFAKQAALGSLATHRIAEPATEPSRNPCQLDSQPIDREEEKAP